MRRQPAAVSPSGVDLEPGHGKARGCIPGRWIVQRVDKAACSHFDRGEAAGRPDQHVIDHAVTVVVQRQVVRMPMLAAEWPARAVFAAERL